MLQTMKKNNRDDAGRGRSTGRTNDFKSSRKNERPENDSRSSSKRFFGDPEDKSWKSDKPSYKSDRNRSSEQGRKQYGERNSGSREESRAPYKKWDSDSKEKRHEAESKPAYKRQDGERQERSYGAKPSYNRSDSERRGGSDSRKPYKKFDKESSDQARGRKPSFGKNYPKRSENPAEQKRASYRFGSEWKEKPYAGKGDESSEAARGVEKKPFNDRNSNRVESENQEKRIGEFKTVYKGRGRDQKPRYETVQSEAVDKRKSPSKFFTRGSESAGEAIGEKPDYDLKKYEKDFKKNSTDDDIRLNKYIANAGVCSRREADTLIENGLISVNGFVVKELGHKVSRKDKVQYQGRILNPEKPVYLLLNKPKDFITTTDDPMERKTVMSLVNNACEERIFPVGRLDRNTTGLLLFTNDGELADKLASPANKIKKIYQVTLDKPLAKKDAEAVLEGLTLEDGPVAVDDMQVLSLDRTILGLEIHVGRNRIVRRIFAHLGYDVIALDRVVYAGLNKKDISRGKYRFLTEKEVINLKFFK